MWSRCCPSGCLNRIGLTVEYGGEVLSLSRRILDAAVEALGGEPRSGQQQMADAVAGAFESGEHLLVQAGTGTGKSLGYLAPALAFIESNPDSRVIVATATLALQSQLANSDIPAAVSAHRSVTGHEVRHAVLKGRTNYACLHRVRDGQGLEQATLLGGEEVAAALRSSASDPVSVVGAEVVALREWAEQEAEAAGLADRDDAPAHTSAAWSQVSIPTRECLGSDCAFWAECFVERSRQIARESPLVVTNHALVAIDAMHGGTALPERDLLILDEAHELVSRVTGAASHELSPQQVERVAKRCLPYLSDELALEFLEQSDELQIALDEGRPERIQDPDSSIGMCLARIRDVSRTVVSAMGDDDPSEKQARAAAKEVFDVAQAMAAMKPTDVLHVSERERFGRWLVVSPLQVSSLIREAILTNTPTVFTSATLKLGGEFSTVASSVGLRRDEEVVDQPGVEESGSEPEDEPDSDELSWRGLDVGSPFDYPRQGILYLAVGLPKPRREGITEEALAEIAELVWAAGGRTLGLFAAQRNAEAAARWCRAELPKQTILCQGDAQLPELTRQFLEEEKTSLFGTLSLWQGIDMPGDICTLVIIDKIPFPRPDDPLMRARQQQVNEAGGNGFMAVAAAHAALLLAQGSGRLIRRASDRGVVAVLDPRLRTAGYGSFLLASMPPFWMTTDREVAVGALRRLDGTK